MEKITPNGVQLPPLAISLTYDEVGRLHRSLSYDFWWYKTHESDLYEKLTDLLHEHLLPGDRTTFTTEYEDENFTGNSNGEDDYA